MHKRSSFILIWKRSTSLISILVCILKIQSVLVSATESADLPLSSSCKGGDDETCTMEQVQLQQPPKKHIFPECRLYLAKSTIPNTNLGLFTSAPLRRGQPIAPPDIIIQLIDYYYYYYNNNRNTDNNNSSAPVSSISRLISDYSWDPQRFGGQFEARSVASILPGIGSIANAMPTFQSSNALAFGARDFDEANVPRTKSAGAGAFTHYHNVTFYASRHLDAGSEIFVYYPEGDWYRERSERITRLQSESGNERERQREMEDSSSQREVTQNVRSVDWLKKHGICVDNLIPGQSKIKNAGRGAFASHFIPEGTIVSASPMILVNRNETLTKRVKHSGKVRKATKQLMVNYMLGHVESSLMFLPLSPIVNLINHGTTSSLDAAADSKTKVKKEANVRLQWSLSDQHDGKGWQHLSLDDFKALSSSTSTSVSGFMMEYIATKDILPNEEILLDYGAKWVEAWNNHKKDWKPLPNAKAYSPSYVMDDVAGLVRTEKEQALHPYPSNVMTGCFYRYSNHERNDGIAALQKSKGEATTVKWKMDRHTFDYDHLRPCSIMQRDEVRDNQGQSQVKYTVMMKNWHGIKKEEMIPKGEIHVVNSVPRQAIRFIDKMYSTDQHLADAFRHEIQIPDDIFPSQWLDLKR